jgi:hypothetical protein
MAQYPPQPDVGGIQSETDPVALAALAGLTPAAIGAATPAQVASAVAGVTPATLGVPTTQDLTNAIVGVTPASLGVPVLAASSTQVIQAQAATVVPLATAGAASQSGNLFEARDSGGVVKASITAVGGIVSAGNVQAQNFFASTAVRSSVLQAASNGTNVATLGTNPRMLVAALNAGEVPLVARGAASQTGDLTQWQDSAGAVKSSMNSFGSLLLRTTTQFGTSALSVQTPATTAEGIIVRGIGSQTANLQEWQNSSAAVVVSISAGGALYTASSIRSGISAANAQIQAQAGSATTVGLVLRAAASQSANLQEWQNSAGSTLMFVSSSGYLQANFGATVTGNTRLGPVAANTADGVGVVGIANATTVPTTNPTGGGILYVSNGGLFWRGSSGTVTPIAPA